jgi:hypothetical protein
MAPLAHGSSGLVARCGFALPTVRLCAQRARCRRCGASQCRLAVVAVGAAGVRRGRRLTHKGHILGVGVHRSTLRVSGDLSVDLPHVSNERDTAK